MTSNAESPEPDARAAVIAAQREVYDAFGALQTAFARLALLGERKSELARQWHEAIPNMRRKWTEGRVP